MAEHSATTNSNLATTHIDGRNPKPNPPPTKLKPLTWPPQNQSHLKDNSKISATTTVTLNSTMTSDKNPIMRELRSDSEEVREREE